MASCALNDLNARRGGEEPPDAQQRVVASAKCIQIVQCTASR